MPDTQPSVGEQFINANNRAVAVETQSLHHGEGFVQQDTLAELQAGKGDLRVNTTDVIRAGDTDVGLVRLDGHQERPHAKGWRAEFLNDGVHLFESLPRLVVHFLYRRNPLAQINHVENGRMTRGQFAYDQIDQLKSGESVQLLAG